MNQQRLRLVPDDPERVVDMFFGHAPGVARHGALLKFQILQHPPVGVEIPQIQNGSETAFFERLELPAPRLGAAADAVRRIDLMKIAREFAVPGQHRCGRDR